ncbi:MAG: nucleotide pyrophosphohydrolase [Gemmatimonadota bacterium]
MSDDRPGDAAERSPAPHDATERASGSASGGALPPSPAGLSLRDAQAAVDAWIGRFEEGYWPPLSNLARLVEEVGELARELNHRYGHKPKKPDEPERDLALELADILFVVIAIANEQAIDLEAAFERVLEKYRVRDAKRWTPRRERRSDEGSAEGGADSGPDGR